MYQHSSYWAKSLKHRKLWRSIYIQGNLRLRQRVKAGINPWVLMCLFIDLTEEEIQYYKAIQRRNTDH